MDARQEIARIAKEDESINSFIVLDKERVSEKGAREEGRLSGLRIAVKSNINVYGLLTSCASKTLENYISPYDATVVCRIKKEAGAIIDGKLAISASTKVRALKNVLLPTFDFLMIPTSRFTSLSSISY